MMRRTVPAQQSGRELSQNPVVLDHHDPLLDPGGHIQDPDLGQLIIMPTPRAFLVFTEAHIQHDPHPHQ